MAPFPVALRDADFSHRFVWSLTRDGRVHLKWTPFGMPRLNQRFADSAFFLYGRNPETNEIEGPRGTGVFIGLPFEDDGYKHHVYAVTCHHVAPQGASIIRVNTKGGKARFIELEPHEWEFIPGGADLAAADISEHVDNDTDEVMLITPRLFVSREFLIREQIGIGEDGFMLGLFANHAGMKRNLIAARFGNLSLLADEDALIPQPNGNIRPTHIFDMRSRSGFSGSPVFIYRTPAGDLRESADRGFWQSIRERDSRLLGMEAMRYSETQENTFLALLGVHLGQFPESVKVSKLERAVSESDDIIRDKDRINIAGGMTIVAPAWEITNLLELPIFMDQRTEREGRVRNEKNRSGIAEPEAIDTGHPGPSSDKNPAVPVASDENPRHREDFTSLLNAAAKTKPQGG